MDSVQSCVSIPGKFGQTASHLKLSQDILSKHTLLIGGTGCGKTNVFNYFVQQLKTKLTKDDVMIIFDTKGDFLRQFYHQGDYIISNSKSHSQYAMKWNIVYCKIKLPKVAKQNWTLLHVQIGQSCNLLNKGS